MSKCMKLCGMKKDTIAGARPTTLGAAFNVGEVMARSAENEGRIWNTLVGQDCKVFCVAYGSLADALPALSPEPGNWRIQAGREPMRSLAKAESRRHPRRFGRRASTAANNAKEPVRGW